MCRSLCNASDIPCLISSAFTDENIYFFLFRFFFSCFPPLVLFLFVFRRSLSCVIKFIIHLKSRTNLSFISFLSDDSSLFIRLNTPLPFSAHHTTTIMDVPPPIVIGLEGLLKYSLPRIIKIRNTAAAMTNFGRLSPFLKRLQVSVLLLGTTYRKLSQYDIVPGSDMCIGICHDSLVQTQGMIEAVLRAEDDNVYKVGTGALIERLPDEINSFISSVELLRSTYHE